MKWLRNNGLSITFFFLFVISLVGQTITGLHQHNQKMLEEGGETVTLTAYLTTGHFLQATFENWESEFLQMIFFVVLTIFLYQKGSSESKDPDGGEEEVDREPDQKKQDAPYPVKKGGILLTLYKYSLTIVLAVLFVLTFVAHFYGSRKDFNEEQLLNGKPIETVSEYLANSRFWFESFQNWQSEFLSVFTIVVLSIFLRQKGSPQSKPVDASNSETGE
jgi:hypothetical protein